MKAIILISICLLTGVLYAQTNKVDSLKQQLQHVSPDTTQIDLLLQLARLLTSQKSDQALLYAKEGYELALQHKDQTRQAKLTNRLGTIYYFKGLYDEALLYYFKALALNEVLRREVDIGGNLNNIAVIYQNLNQNKQALHYYFQALPKLQSEGNTKQLARIYNNMGIVYQLLQDKPRALKYYKKSLQLSKKWQDTKSTAVILNNIGQVHYDLKAYHQSLQYTLQAMRLNQQIKYDYELANNLNNLGSIYTQLQKYDLANKYLQKAYLLLKQLKVLPLWSDYYKNQIDLLEKQGRYKDAITYYRRFTKIKDSTFNLDNSKRVAALQARYDLKKKEQENQLLKQQKVKSQQTIEDQQSKNTTLTFITMFGIMMALIALFVAFKLFKAKEYQRKINQTLAEKNEEIQVQADILQRQKEAINHQKEELQTQTETLRLVNQRLKDLDNFKQTMTHTIVHDLKTPLNYLIVLSDQIEIKQTAQQMLNMVLNILDVQKFEEAQMKLQKAEWALQTIIEDAVKQVAFLADQKSIQIKTTLQPNTFVKVDHHLTVRVFSNLLTNAIKYSPTSGIITIEQSQVLDYEEQPVTKIQVKDEGEGIPQDKIAMVFDKFAQINARDLGAFRSTGLGLTFCKMVVEAHQGEISINSQESRGTIVSLSLPLVHTVSIVQDHPMKASIWTDVFQHQMDKLQAMMTKADKEHVMPLVAALQTLDVYDYSEIKKVLQQLDETDSQAIKLWKHALHQTLLTCDEDKYQHLLHLIG